MLCVVKSTMVHLRERGDMGGYSPEELVEQIFRNMTYDPLLFVRMYQQIIHEENPYLYKYIQRESLIAKLNSGNKAVSWNQQLWSYVYAYRKALAENDYTAVPKVTRKDLKLLDEERAMLEEQWDHERSRYMNERLNTIRFTNPVFAKGIIYFINMAQEIFLPSNTTENINEPIPLFVTAVTAIGEVARVSYTALQFPPEKGMR